MDAQRFIPGDANLIEKIVSYLKAKGIFDEFRHECLADVDTKSSCQNLSQRVDGYTSKFLANETWNPDLNKNELRNKLRRHIDESGMLAVGADHVVEQVINPKVYQFFLKIQETVHQYIKEQTEAACKKVESVLIESTPAVSDLSEASTSKSKAVSSDPIADILSFTQSKPKVVTPNTPQKAEASQSKYSDSVKRKDDLSKKKEEKVVVKEEKINVKEEKVSVKEEKVSVKEERVSVKEEKLPTSVEISCEAPCITPTEIKPLLKKDIKLEECDTSADTVKKYIKEEKPEETKSVVSDSAVLEGKYSKPNIKTKDYKSVYKNERSKYKSKSHKTSSSPNDSKKHKKEHSSKTSGKNSKLLKVKSRESSNTLFIKSDKSEFRYDSKNVSKSKPVESSATKASDSKKIALKQSSRKEKDRNLKTKINVEKSEKIRSGNAKIEKFLMEGSDASKGSKASSHDSDAEKRSSSSIKNDKSKTYHKKEHSSKKIHKDDKTSLKRALFKDSEDPDSRIKTDKSNKLDKTKESIIEAAKISSRSNSHGSSSSVGSSSNTSKDNLSQASDDTCLETEKHKKKKNKGKFSCYTSKELPPPPPPPPPSASCELPSSEISFEESAASSSNHESSDDESSEKIASDSDSCPLNSSYKLHKHKTHDITDIFMYSSSSDFEGFGTSPDKTKVYESDISVSSVHTSDLSSFEDELSDDESSDNEELKSKKRKRRLTLKEAQELIKNKAVSKRWQLRKENSKKIQYSSVRNLSSEDHFQEFDLDGTSTAEEFPSGKESKRSLRRPRKPNPKYISSEYTTIFNSKKDVDGSKQSSPTGKVHPISAKSEMSGNGEDDLSLSSDKAFESSSYSSDEIESLRFDDNEKIKKRKALKKESKRKSMKRKLNDLLEEASCKRPCSRSSVDSFSSEFATNENMPFNNNDQNILRKRRVQIELESGFKKSTHLRRGRPNNGALLRKTFKNTQANAEQD